LELSKKNILSIIEKNKKKDFKIINLNVFGNEILFDIETSNPTLQSKKNIESSVKEILSKMNIKAGVLHNSTLKPFDENSLIRASKRAKLIFTVEEHLISGGLGSIVLETLNNERSKSINNVHRIGIQNKFIKKYGIQKDLLNYCNLTSNKIILTVKRILNEKKY